jgi:branched-chain amino acid transport system ATP-binding protein
VTKLTIENLEAGYGAVRALHGVSLEVREGETVALLGTNGNGKSTLMKCVMGLLKPSRGSIVLEMDGGRVELAGKSPQEIVALGVALVPEGRRLFPRLTVGENLLLGAFRRGARSAIERNLALCHDAFPILRERSAQLAGSLSGGQQQMLAIAKCMACSPRVLLLDEPTQGLSVEETEQAVDTLARFLQASRMTVLLVEHDMEVVFRLAHRITVLHRGAVIADGAPDQVKADPAVQDAYLGGFE